MSIKIRKSPSADTRSADHIVTKQELLDSSRMHIDDVRKAMQFFAEKIIWAACSHDHTKVDSHFDEFYKQFEKAQITGNWGHGWYDEVHTVQERHHFDNAPDDVNLIDVLEQIADSVMAGLARSGKYEERPMPKGLLEKAYNNTVKMLLEQTEVQE